MSIFIGCLYVIEVIVCLLLALVVMLQKPKEGGLGGAIGGGMLESSLGADAGSVLIKTTAVLGAIFLLNTLVLARLTSTVHSRSLMATEAEPSATEAPALPAAAPELPAAPVAPAAPAAAPVKAPALPVAAPVKAPAAPVAPKAPAVTPVKAPAAPAVPKAPAAPVDAKK